MGETITVTEGAPDPNVTTGPPAPRQYHFEVPEFDFAGTMGGQNVYDCGACGALVRDVKRPTHVHFHEALEAGDLCSR